MLKYLILFASICTTLSSQKLKLDESFGSKGRVKIDLYYTNVSKPLLFDSERRSLFVLSSKQERDGFSDDFIYYRDFIYKIDINTGKLDKQFSDDGLAKHSIKSPKHRGQGNYWQSSENKIICFNYNTPDKDILIFDKDDGKLSYFPKTEAESKFRLTSFIYFDENNNRFLTQDNNSMYWLDEEGVRERLDLNEFIDPQAESIYFSPVQVCKDSIVFLAREFVPSINSTELNSKTISLKDNKFVLLNTVKESHHGLFNKGSSSKSQLTNLMDNALDYKIEMLAKNLDVPKDYFHDYKYIDEEDNIYYALYIDNRYTEIKNGVRNLKARYYTIAIIDRKIGSIRKFPLDELLESKMTIQDIKHLGNREFIVLAEKVKRKKADHFLYKVVID